MALRFPILVKAQTTTTGTGTLTIAEPGQVRYRTFTRAVTDLDLADGDQVAFITADTTVTNGPKLAELAVGTWNNTAKTLTRDTIYQPGGTPVSWGAGTRDVVVVDNPVMFLLLAGGTITGVIKLLLSGTIISQAAETAMVVQRSASSATDVGVSFISGNAGQVKVNAGDTDNEKMGGWRYDNSTNVQTFRTNGTDRQIIDASGVLKTVLGGNSYDAFAGGATTVWPFYQAAAPIGWTKSTTHNDKALRVVSGTGGGSGGTLATSASTVGSTALTIEQLPAHSHIVKYLNNAAASINPGSPANYDGTGGMVNTSTTGSNETHTHTLALAYIDVIICSKN